MMRLISSVIVLFISAAICGAAAPEVLTIQTTDGQTFRNAAVESVNPAGIDIGYVNADGVYVVKELPFKTLPANLQKKFGYNPVTGKAFSDKLAQYSKGNMAESVETEKKRLEDITKEINEKFAGKNIKIKPEDLQYEVYARRISVLLTPLAETKTGCVVKIKNVISGKKIDSDVIQIDGQALPLSGDWSGFIYPTGLKTRYNNKDIPVYSDNQKRAADLMNYYLNIYSEYAATHQKDTTGKTEDSESTTPTGPPDQAYSPADSTSSPETAAAPNTTVVNNYTTNAYSTPDLSAYPYYYDGPYYGWPYWGGGYYFIGGDYGPVYWWGDHHGDHHGDGHHDGDHHGDHHGDGHHNGDHHGDHHGDGRHPNDHSGTAHSSGLHEFSRIAPLSQSARYSQMSSFRTPTHTVVRSGGFRQAAPHFSGGGRGGGRR